MRKILLGAVLAAGVAVMTLGPSPAMAVGHTETRTYVAAGSDVGLIVDLSSEGGPAYGGGIFTPRAGETSVRLTIADAVAGDHSYYYSFDDDSDDPTAEPLSNGFICNNNASIPIPAGAKRFSVSLDQALVALECPLGKGRPATTGTLTATFT